MKKWRIKREDLQREQVTDFPEVELPTPEEDLSRIFEELQSRGISQWAIIGFPESTTSEGEIATFVNIRINVADDNSVFVLLESMRHLALDVVTKRATMELRNKSKKEKPM
jgi:hypothetical protein